MRRLILAVLLVSLITVVVAPSAQADSVSGVITSASFQPASPATAGSADNTTAMLSLAYANSSDTAKSLTLTFPAGFLAAPASVSTTCSTVQLAAAACPAAAEIGSGQATVGTVIGDQMATLSIYLMPPPNNSAVVGVGVILNADVLGIPIVTTTTGTGGFINSPAGVPLLQIAIPSLPAEVAVPVVGSVAIQLKQLTMILDAQAPSGKQFVYLPTSCGSASTGFAVTTVGGATGAATASFTPTGCPLAYSGGQVGGAAQVIDTNFDAAFQTSLTFPTGPSTSAITIGIPNTALRANPIYAALDCAMTAPFTGCTQIGTVTATTPLLSTPLTGTAYLTGSALGGFGIALSFPAPFNINLTGNISSGSGTTLVVFPSIPDLPLTALQLALTGSSVSAFQASCGAGAQTLTAALTGNGGAATLMKSSALNITGCPASGASGTGSQVANYGNGSTSSTKKKATAPRVSSALVTKIASGKPSFTFTVKAGSAKLKSVKLALPSGLSFVKARLAKTLHSSAGATERLSGRTLIVTLKKTASTETVRIASGGLKSSTALAKSVRKRRTKRVRFKVLARTAAPSTRFFSFTLDALRT